MSNVDRISEALLAEPADLLVLPELCTSGYLFESPDALRRVAEPLSGPSVTALCKVAVARSTTLVFGVAELDGSTIYNTAVVAASDGQVSARRKRHLTRLEQPLFAPGRCAEAIEVNGLTIGALTCFDAWFPERFRVLVKGGARIACCPSNFGGSDSLDVFRVRALENRIFVIVANRIGRERVGDTTAAFRGDSRVIAPDGSVLRAAGARAGIGVVDVDPTEAEIKSSMMSDDLVSEWSKYSVAEG